jgi:hypothetical protein
MIISMIYLKIIVSWREIPMKGGIHIFASTDPNKLGSV